MKLNPFTYYNYSNIHELENFFDKRCKDILYYLDSEFDFEGYGTTDITKVIKDKISQNMLLTEIDIRLYEEVDYIEDLLYSIYIMQGEEPPWSICVTYFSNTYVNLDKLDNYYNIYTYNDIKEKEKKIRLRIQEKEE